MLKVLAVFLFFVSVCFIAAYGKFNNEFLRITITISCMAFTYYSYLHWIVRWLSLIIHVFIKIVICTYGIRAIILNLPNSVSFIQPNDVTRSLNFLLLLRSNILYTSLL